MVQESDEGRGEALREWRSWDSRLLRAALLAPEDSASREGKWRKRRLSICFRIHRSDEGGWRGFRKIEIYQG